MCVCVEGKGSGGSGDVHAMCARLTLSLSKASQGRKGDGAGLEAHARDLVAATGMRRCASTRGVFLRALITNASP